MTTQNDHAKSTYAALYAAFYNDTIEVIETSFPSEIILRMAHVNVRAAARCDVVTYFCDTWQVDNFARETVAVFCEKDFTDFDQAKSFGVAAAKAVLRRDAAQALKLIGDRIAKDEPGIQFDSKLGTWALPASDDSTMFDWS